MTIAGVDVGWTKTLADVIREFRTWPSLYYWDERELSLATINQFFDSGNQAGGHYYWSRSNYIQPRSGHVTSPEEEFQMLAQLWEEVFVPTIKESTKDDVSVTIEIVQMGGKVGEIPSDHSAFFHRSACYEFHLIWGSSSPDSVPRDYRKLSTWYQQRITTGWLTSDLCLKGGYVNINTPEEHSEVTESPVYGSNYSLLQQLKTEHDPTNVFSQNHNILPHDFKPLYQPDTTNLCTIQ